MTINISKLKQVVYCFKSSFLKSKSKLIFFQIVAVLIALAGAYPQAGLVGPSGVIGPSGLVGPSGPVQFHQPAFAFLGHNAHAHAAALHNARARQPTVHIQVISGIYAYIFDGAA